MAYNKEDEEKYTITKRDRDRWQQNKAQKTTKRKVLSDDEIKVFLELIASLASPIIFERKLGLAKNDIEFYKRQLDITSRDEARGLLKDLQKRDTTEREERINSNTVTQQKVEEERNQSLDKSNEQKATKETEQRSSRLERRDPVRIAAEDAERQKKLEASNEDAQRVQEGGWQLSLNGVGDADKKGLFYSDIVHRGINFCTSKYNTTKSELINEARRLKIKVDWDNVRR